MEEAAAKPKVAVLVRDLIFATKIQSTARAMGVEVACIEAVDGLDALLREGLSLLVVDLNSAGDDAVAAIRQSRSAARGTRLIAFVSHVDEELAAAARTAGADEVMPRSRFSRELPQLLAALLPHGRSTATGLGRSPDPP